MGSLLKLFEKKKTPEKDLSPGRLCPACAMPLTDPTWFKCPRCGREVSGCMGCQDCGKCRE